MDQASTPRNLETARIVFFDGVCNLCNQFVDFLLTVQNRNEAPLLFAPLQGETAKRLLGPARTSQMKSVLFYDQGKILESSDAVLAITAYLPAPFKWMKQFSFVPHRFREAIYFWCAEYRYSIFGKRETCRLPEPDEKSFFLD